MSATEPGADLGERTASSSELARTAVGRPESQVGDGKLPRSVHADKFRLGIAGLVGIALGALVVAVAILAAHSSNAGDQGVTQPWSSWSPQTSGAEAQIEIADYVSPLYRVDEATQLAVVSPLQVTGVDSSGNIGGAGITVAVNTSGDPSKQTLSLLNGKTAAYRICGLSGSDCELAGTSSALKDLLLRREALELALYTLKYEPKVQNVVAVLPPGYVQGSAVTPADHETVVVLMDRHELQPLLSVPLSSSLAADPPALSELSVWEKTEEAGLVDQATGSSLFAEKTENQPDGTNLLVLNQIPAQ